MKSIGYADKLFKGNIYRSMDIAASGLTANRKKMDAISSNIANASVTNADGNGNPYLRRHVTMNVAPEKTFAGEMRRAGLMLETLSPRHIKESSGGSGRSELTPFVEGQEIEIANMKKNVVYDPSHPDADANGFVTYPDISVVEEMVDLMVASRAFDANITVINAAKQMISKSLDI